MYNKYFLYFKIVAVFVVPIMFHGSVSAQQVIVSAEKPGNNLKTAEVNPSSGPSYIPDGGNTSTGRDGMLHPVYSVALENDVVLVNENQYSKVTPSVAKDFITIQLSELYLADLYVACRVINAKGYTVINQILNSPLTEIDVRLLVPGYYSVLLRTDKLLIGNYKFRKL